MNKPGLKQQERPQAELASSNAVPPPPPAPPAPPAPRVRTNEQYLSSVVVTATALQSPGLDDFDSRSTIQAGAGTPGWDQGNDYQLGWSGPVTAEQTTRLLIAPRWLVRLLRVAMVALLAALLAKLLASLRPWRLPWTAARGAGVAGALLLAVALLPSISHAQTLPTQQLLDQLKVRLTEAPLCAPDCASVLCT